MPYQDPSTKRDRYLALTQALLNDRSSWDAHWRELADYILPTRARFFTQERRSAGQKRNQNIIDSTATFAASTLESGLHAGLTSPARPWMNLTTPDPELSKVPAVKEWLNVVTTRMLAVFATTNLYQGLPICYGDLGTFGTAAMGVFADEEDLFRVQNFPIGSYAVSVGKRGRVTTFVHETEMTVRQIVEEYCLIPGKTGAGSIDWEKCSTRVKEHWDKGQYEVPIDVCWIITPNEDYDRSKPISRYMKYASCHFEKGTDERKFLRESGYQNFPVMVPRWRVSSTQDAYGNECPGIRSLGDVKQLQLMERRAAQAVNKLVDPPLQAPNALRTQKTSLLAGDVTYVDVSKGQDGIRSIHEININLEHFSMMEDRVRYRIQRAFYEDLFLMLTTRDQSADSSQPLTAREVVERHEEKLLALGPVLERTNDELLEPMVDRAFEMMNEAGFFPDPPPDLDGRELKVEFISILAQAQKSVSVGAQDRFLQSVLALAEAMPGVVDKIDENAVVDAYAEQLGVDPRLVRSNEEAQARGQERTEAQNKMAQAQAAKDMAAAGKSASETELNGDTALARMVAGAAAANPANGVM